MAGIRLQDVHFSYGDQPILRGIDLTVASGEILGLLGANGCGKTTTFKLLASLLRPSSGTIHVAGVNVLANPKEAKTRTSYVPDEPILYPRLSALENMNMFSVLWGVDSDDARTRTERLLHQVGLWSVRNQWFETYSRGMKQKLALCAALLHEPTVLLMDEPFSGLDVEAGLWARDLLRDFTADGGCVVFTSHTPELVEAFAERVAILEDGCIQYDKPRNAVRQDGGIVTVFHNLHDASNSAYEIES